MNLVPHHTEIVAMLQKRTNLRLMAFCLECSAGELRKYIEQHELDGPLESVKRYPIHGARYWQPWKVNPYDLR